MFIEYSLVLQYNVSTLKAQKSPQCALGGSASLVKVAAKDSFTPIQLVPDVEILQFIELTS